MEPRFTSLVATFLVYLSTALSEHNENVDYYNGTSFPPPYDQPEGNEDYNRSTTTSGLSSKGLVDDSEEASFSGSTVPPELTIPPQTSPPHSTTTRRPTTLSTPYPNSTLPTPGFSTPGSNSDDPDNKGNGQGQGKYPQNPAPAPPVPGSPISDGFPGTPPGGPAADAPAPGLPGPDGPSTCLCLSLCLTATPGPQAPPGTGPCVSICACVGASTQSGPPPPPGKDVPGGPGAGSIPGPGSGTGPGVADLPAGDLPAAGTDTAQSAVQDGTAVAASQAPPAGPGGNKETESEEPEDDTLP